MKIIDIDIKKVKLNPKNPRLIKKWEKTELEIIKVKKLHG